MDSILNTIKKLLGIPEEYETYDTDIIMHINSVFSILTQLGIGPLSGFSILDSSATWTDFLDDYAKLEMVKSYIYCKVRLVFDPPTNSVVMDALNKRTEELEWRMFVEVDPIEK